MVSTTFRTSVAALAAAALAVGGLVAVAQPSSANHLGATISGAPTAVVEGDPAVITVTRSGSATETVTIPFTISATSTVGTTPAEVVADVRSATGTATGTVTIAENASTATFTVFTVEDLLVEGSESFAVSLGDQARPATAGDTRVITILDDDFVGGGGGGGADATPTPTATGTGTPAPTTSATPSGSATPVGTGSPRPTGSVSPPASVQCVNPVGITLNREFIIPGIPVRVTVTAPVGSEVQLQAYSRPSTTYRVVRQAVVANSNGTVTFDVVPGTNTRLFANCVSQTRSASSQRVINVRTALSLTVVRNGRRNYTFQGRILPRRAGQLITLYRVTNNGTRVLTSQIKTDDSGTYRINRRFTGSGTFGFLTRTGQTLTNAAGESTSAAVQRSNAYLQNGRGTARPTAIF